MSEAIEQLGVTVLPDGRMDRANTARYLGLSVQTLATWSMRKIGPSPIRIGGRVFYRKADIDRFIAGCEAA
jgi:hypothetical protein